MKLAKWIIFLAAASLARDVAAQTASQQTASGSQAASTQRQDAPKPDTQSRDVSRPYTQRAVNDVRNGTGFILGASEMYDNDAIGALQYKDSEAITRPFARIFFNVGRLPSRFHFDYGFAYRFYNHTDQLNTAEHEASIGYRYQPSRRSTFAVADYARYGPNDLLGLYGGALYPPPGAIGPPQQVFYDSQLSFRNSFSSTWDYQATRNSRISAFAWSNITRFRRTENQDTDSFEVGMGYERSLSRNWSLVTNASNTWVDSADQTRDGWIARFTGGPKFRFGTFWEISGSAGVEVVQDQFGNRTGAAYDADLRRQSESMLLDLSYQKRSIYQIGLPALGRADVAQLLWEQELLSWLHLQLSPAYYRRENEEGGYFLETASGQGGLQFLIRSNLVASANATYLYQRQLAGSQGILNINRYILYATIQFIFPSVRR